MKTFFKKLPACLVTIMLLALVILPITAFAAEDLTEGNETTVSEAQDTTQAAVITSFEPEDATQAAVITSFEPEGTTETAVITSYETGSGDIQPRTVETQQTEESNTGAKAIAAAIAIGLASAFGALGMGIAIAKTTDSISRQPEVSDKIRATLMLGLIFIETAIIYSLLVVILIIFVL